MFNDSDPVAVLNQPPVVRQALLQAGIHTVGVLCSRREEEILVECGGIGPQKLQDLKDALALGQRRLGERIVIGPRGDRVEWPVVAGRVEKLAASWMEKAEQARKVRDYRLSAGRATTLVECAQQLLDLAGHRFLEVRSGVFCHLIPTGSDRGKDRRWIARFEGESPWAPACCALCGDASHHAERCPNVNEPRILSAEEVEGVQKKYAEAQEKGE